MSLTNRTGSVSRFSSRHSFVRKNFGLPVTEISGFATENLVTGIKISRMNTLANMYLQLYELPLSVE